MMKKNHIALLFVLILSLALSACSSNTGSNNSSPSPSTSPSQVAEPTLTTKEMADKLLAQAEQPKLVDLKADEVKTLYGLDTNLLDQYTARIPLMNVKTNEVSIFKVKDAKDLPAVQAAAKKRATDVQKQFETYLQDQYENAQNYKLVTHGNYVLFLITDKENADKLVKTFDSFFAAK